ncbi:MULTISPECIES: hypothetical protein [unclassified Streptomyces]|uniref:hypothetical protein n=1 Tax=unclassified Streptomyces TaxID=2593676 RepID=UPI002E2E7C13|nr:hypothetical protein [Streptomyces sp. NBC_00441]
MNRGIIAACTVAVALAVTATGCTHGGAAERDTTWAERLRISDATEVLTGRCMNRAGFRYWTSTRLSLEESRPLDYVNDDVDWAAEHGYGSRIQEKTDKARRANPNGNYRAGLSPQRRDTYDKALDGGRNATFLTTEVPTATGTGRIGKRLGGCSAQAEKRLYGDPATWFRVNKTVSNLTSLYVPRITRDEKFTAALADWSRCMGRAGHPYPDPPAAQEAVARQAAELPRAKAFEAEKRVAVTEARCARESSLAAVTREREKHYRAALPARYREQIDVHRRLEHQAYTRAAGITGPRA